MTPSYDNERFRIRPSVSLIPMPQVGRIQFFISDTRQKFCMDFQENIYIDILKKLDGSLSCKALYQTFGLNQHQVVGLELLFKLLTKRCVIEDINIVEKRVVDPFRRVKNFLSSYIPYDQLESVWERISQGNVVIAGAGGIGSWVVVMLAQFGLRNFTLIDDDVVKSHNLNRSFFSDKDIGVTKTLSLKRFLEGFKSSYYSVESIPEKIKSSKQLSEMLGYSTKYGAIINCADFPSVSQTSAIVNELSFSRNVPYIIAGGYNMHLSLVGPTVIPGKSPCFSCMLHAMNEVHLEELQGAKRIVRQHRNIGNLGPLAAISASFVANEWLKLKVGEPYMMPNMLGKRGEFNFFTKKLTIEQYDRWDCCPYCGRSL